MALKNILSLCPSVWFVCRDSLWLCVLNSCTSLVAGFAVFSALGFMSLKQGVPIEMVVESGIQSPMVTFSVLLSESKLSLRIKSNGTKRCEKRTTFQSSVLSSRPRLGIHCFPSGCCHDATSSALGCVLLYNANFVGTGYPGETRENTLCYYCISLLSLFI